MSRISAAAARDRPLRAIIPSITLCLTSLRPFGFLLTRHVCSSSCFCTCVLRRGLHKTSYSVSDKRTRPKQSPWLFVACRLTRLTRLGRLAPRFCTALKTARLHAAATVNRRLLSPPPSAVRGCAVTAAPLPFRSVFLFALGRRREPATPLHCGTEASWHPSPAHPVPVRFSRPSFFLRMVCMSRVRSRRRPAIASLIHFQVHQTLSSFKGRLGRFGEGFGVDLCGVRRFPFVAALPVEPRCGHQEALMPVELTPHTVIPPYPAPPSLAAAKRTALSAEDGCLCLSVPPLPPCHYLAVTIEPLRRSGILHPIAARRSGGERLPPAFRSGYPTTHPAAAPPPLKHPVLKVPRLDRARSAPCIRLG